MVTDDDNDPVRKVKIINGGLVVGRSKIALLPCIGQKLVFLYITLTTKYENYFWVVTFIFLVTAKAPLDTISQFSCNSLRFSATSIHNKEVLLNLTRCYIRPFQACYSACLIH